MTNLEPSSSATSPVALPQSPRHSTLPKTPGYLENNEGENGDDVEAGEGNNNGDGSDVKVAPPVFEEKFLVVMSGEMKPTFIATPISSRVSSFGSCSSGCTASNESSTEKSEGEEEGEKK
ncbi:PREDICTED: protein GLUTAMINE DUMPER 1-like [Nicotiana attenuata]|uniref:protein GLUTAMINE DUMPER 1-like n=1 Tax=Nicotiana attenuata TaxID=49451 RepID=UPI000904E771|nr:PREDICTED: protein GLUTAMINE DUMPER 1-like [Nicotiana attenuata]